MIVIASSVFGILLGVLTARNRGGNRKDMAQYAAGFGLCFMIVGLFATILIERLAG